MTDYWMWLGCGSFTIVMMFLIFPPMMLANEVMTTNMIAQATNDSSIIPERYSVGIGSFELAHDYSNPNMDTNITVTDKWEQTTFGSMLGKYPYWISDSGGNEYRISRENFRRVVVGKTYTVKVMKDYPHFVKDFYGFTKEV